MSNESPIFRKSYEMLVWLLAHTRKFPKDQRFVMAKRMEEAALDFHDSLLRAARGKRPQTSLETADFHLARLKDYNRLSQDLKLHSLRQYEFLAKQLDELGRLLGGWLRSLAKAGGARGKSDESCAARGVVEQ